MAVALSATERVGSSVARTQTEGRMALHGSCVRMPERLLIIWDAIAV